MLEGYANHIYYKIMGEGQPLVMIAGLGADHTSSIPLANQLTNNFKIILFDNRGIGKSSIPDDGECTISKMAEDVALLLNELDVKKAHIAGHSLGGYVAQQFAAKYHKHVDKLILISTKTHSQPVQKLYVETTFNMMKQNVPREIIIKNTLCWLFSNIYLGNPKNIENFLDGAMKKPLEESRKSYFYQVGAALNFDTSYAASIIKSPTLIISGEQDHLVTIQDSQNLHKTIKNSHIAIVKEMAHMLHVEVPGEIAKLIKKFIYEMVESE